MTVAVCIASGPSLVPEDVEYVKGKAEVYVVNDCHKIAPWADVLYACDLEWWRWHEGVEAFAGEKWTINRTAAEEFNLHHIQGEQSLLWSTRQGCIATGFNSGFQVMNLAALRGATRIILLGYDMGFSDEAKRHWFGNHPAGLHRASNYGKFIRHFERAAKVIETDIINCSRKSALRCFPQASLRDVL